jgi:hypothetical protein
MLPGPRPNFGHKPLYESVAPATPPERLLKLVKARIARSRFTPPASDRVGNVDIKDLVSDISYAVLKML